MHSSARITDWEDRILNCGAGDGQSLSHVRCFAAVGSTMDCAREALPNLGPRDRALFLAREQLQGRGRQGRVWAQPKVGFYGTYAFAAPQGIASIAGFSLVVGIAVARLVQSFGSQVRLKWPNDIYTDEGAKFSGILVDIVTLKDVPWILTGIGINLSGEPQVDTKVSSLETLTGRRLDVPSVAAQLSPILLKLWEEYAGFGFAAFKSEWLGLAYALGKQITIDTGSDRLSGIFNGVSDRGGIVLERGSELVEIISGHVIA